MTPAFAHLRVRRVTLGFGFALFLLHGAVAHAQTWEIGTADESRNAWESPQNFALELRGGPYAPEVDSEFTNGATPYANIFGTGAGVVLSLEFDWQFLRINPFCSIGVGVSVGYSSNSAVAPITSGPDAGMRPSGGEATGINVIPMYAVGVIRFDGLARNTWFPVVPYIKFGPAYSMWWVTLGSNLARRDSLSVGNPTGSAPDFLEAAVGGTWGYQAAVGLMLRLDQFEPQTQRAWDTDMGVNHSYLFFEGDRNGVNGLGARPQLHLGQTNWVAGVALEF